VVYLMLWFWGTVGLAMLSYRYLESPFLRMKERFAPLRDSLGGLAGKEPRPHQAEGALS
jgi:peptidoglycan/LPS O-acetylase OafA/YrhL